MNKNLISFISGAIFVAAVIPLISEAVTIISALSENVQTKISCKTYHHAKELQDLQAQVEKQNTFAIGFQAPSSEEYEDE